LLWHALNTPMGYGSPMLFEVGGERHVVVCGRTNTLGLRIEDGVTRWIFPWSILNNERPIAQPVLIGTNRLMLSAAYLTGAVAFEVDKVGANFETRELWRSRQLKNKFASSVFHEGFVYGLDEDILTCLDATTGERKWKDGRYGYGQVLLAGGYLVVLCGDGDLALLKATPDAWTELARFNALKGKTWNVPALAGGKIFIRNNAEMACYQIGK
jgi:outer membrane protein assembly factor BamB